MHVYRRRSETTSPSVILTLFQIIPLSRFPSKRMEFDKLMPTFQLVKFLECPKIEEKVLELKEWSQDPIYDEKGFSDLFSISKLNSLLSSDNEIMGKLKKVFSCIKEWSQLIKVDKEYIPFFQQLAHDLSTLPHDNECSLFNYLINICIRIGYEVLFTYPILLSQCRQAGQKDCSKIIKFVGVLSLIITLSFLIAMLILIILLFFHK
jgi:hypothetical protein